MAFEQGDKIPIPQSTASALALSQQIQGLFPSEKSPSASKTASYDTTAFHPTDDRADTAGDTEPAKPENGHVVLGAAAFRAVGALSSAYFSLDKRPVSGSRLYSMTRVSSDALSQLSSKSIPAHVFLESELKRLKLQASKKGITTSQNVGSDEESELALKIKTVKVLKDQIPPGRMGSLEKIDFSRLEDDTRRQKAFSAVTDFEKAQDNVIAEHRADMARLTAEEREAYANTRRAATTSFHNDISALFGAQAAELAIDWFMPRNVVSKKTLVADFIIPSVAMGMNMTVLGKWAPLARAGIMVGTHAAFHLAFDQQVDKK
jgi:hypothetical protein